MPDQPTAKPTCYPAQHLPGHLYKTWHVMFSYTGGGVRLFKASIRHLCNMLNQTENTVTASVNKLCEIGWLVRHGGGKDPRTGRNRPYEYDVLSHDEFVKRHPGSCPPPVYSVLDEDGKSPLTLDEVAANNLLRNLPLPPDTIVPNPMGEVIAQVMSQLSPEQRAENDAHLRAISGLPPSPVEQGPPHLGLPMSGPTSVEQGRSDTSLPRSAPPRSTDVGPTSVDGVTRPRSTEEELDLSTTTPPPLLLPPTPSSTAGSGGGDDAKTVSDGRTKLRADQLVVTLFRKQTDETPGKVSAAQRKFLNEQDALLGRDLFRAAVEAWLKAQPWDDKTASHLTHLVQNFPDYVQRVKDAAAKAEARKRQAEAQKEFDTWLTLDHYIGSLAMYYATDDEKARVKQILAMPRVGTVPPDVRKYIDDLDAALKQRHKATQQVDPLP
jgi:hypothetical protein